MKNFHPPKPKLWQGRSSGTGQYLHEKVDFLNLETGVTLPNPGFAILGYACEEGVRRNQGRIGAVEGPVSIIQELAKLPHPRGMNTQLCDAGLITCSNQNLEGTQELLSGKVKQLLDLGSFPLLLGGGHDIAYGHYMGLRSYVDPEESIGIINLDAHFDLRSAAQGPNSGTPFYQIAMQLEEQNQPFHYFCLGIREEANSAELFDAAGKLGVNYVMNSDFHIGNTITLKKDLEEFLEQVDRIYLTIDLDGFSSAYSPGVSAASPFGFSPDIAIWTLEEVIHSGKLMSLDL
ncbi:MAG: arginase family protein, partial [Eudoraea sp.]|nr:arginase family protein [Eudoraea sp.]